MKCQVRPSPAHSAALASASWWRFSPTSVTPRSASSRTSVAGKNSVTTTSRTSSGSLPASPQPRAGCVRGRPPGRRAISWRRSAAVIGRASAHPDHAGQAGPLARRHAGPESRSADSRVQRDTSCTVTPTPAQLGAHAGSEVERTG